MPPTRSSTRAALAAAAALALLVPACDRPPAGNSTVNPDNYMQLRAGWTEAQATELLGPPTAATEKGGIRTLAWDVNRFHAEAQFRDGKLVGRKATLDGLALTDDAPPAVAPKLTELDAPPTTGAPAQHVRGPGQ